MGGYVSINGYIKLYHSISLLTLMPFGPLTPMDPREPGGPWKRAEKYSVSLTLSNQTKIRGTVVLVLVFINYSKLNAKYY